VTALRPGELLAELVIPPQPLGARFGYEKLKLCQSSWPIATAAWVVGPASARLALGGVAATPVLLEVEPPLLADLAELSRRIEEAIEEPWSDVLARGDYRRSVAPVVARRALNVALSARATVDANPP
jgi:carbon-monoxide dehydrogenase medium subunit